MSNFNRAKSQADSRCADMACTEGRCPERRIHDAYKQGRWAMYTSLFVVEDSVRTRTGALWSQSQVLDPGVGLEVVTTQAIANTDTMTAKALRAYLDGQKSMLVEYMRHPAAHLPDTETGHLPQDSEAA